MNPAQRKYATERVRTIRAAKLEKLRVVFMKAALPQLSPAARYELIMSAAVDYREVGGEIGYSDSPRDIWDFSGYEGHTDAQKKAYAQQQATIETEARKVTDQLMLGDADGALAAITAFEALEV